MAQRDLAVNGERTQLKQAASGLLCVQLFCSVWQLICMMYVRCSGSSYSCSVSPLSKLAIKSLINTAKNIHNNHLMHLNIHRYYFGHSFHVKAHGTRVVGQYLYCSNHIMGDMSIALALVSIAEYSRSVRHFDPPMKQVSL